MAPANAVRIRSSSRLPALATPRAMVTDDEILAAYHLLGSKEGVFCEPASAAGVAGIIKLSRDKMFKVRDKVVCILTGHGLKDPDTAIAAASAPPVLPAEDAAVADYLRLGS